MRSLKLTVRRLTQTELVAGEVRSGRLNDSLLNSLASDQILLYKRLIVDFGLDDVVATYACLQTNFRGVEEVLDYLFETFEHESGKIIMQHPFIGFKPSLAEGDLENPVSGSDEICFLCQGSK